MYEESDFSLIAVERFIQSTRESGYKGLVSAVAELVDNALQADARNIRIALQQNDQRAVQVLVQDDGHGMSPDVLSQSLRFGGTTRFNDRSGIGRFGMGLPNASLSLARRVDVVSWKGKSAHTSYIDVDEIADKKMRVVPAPVPCPLPNGFSTPLPRTGTLVVWNKCDRIEVRRVSTMARRLVWGLGKAFRYFLWDGIQIWVNDTPVSPVDPLFLHPNSLWTGASQFQEVWECEISADPARANAAVGRVTVTFSELPLAPWHSLSNDEKRKMGVANGAGVSVVRGHREVDFGWFFMGAKRRENYDDWWRCEVRFDPILDEAFGITHTKQQIRPADYLVEALQTHVETMAKALNSRVRRSYMRLKSADVSRSAEAIAEESEEKLRALPKKCALADASKEIAQLKKRNPVLRDAVEADDNGVKYRLVEDQSSGASFFQPLVSGNCVVGVIDTRHRFYKSIYAPLIDGKVEDLQSVTRALQLLLLSAARAEAAFTRKQDVDTIARFRKEWSDVLNVLLARL